MGDRPKLHRLSRAGWVGGAEGVLGDVVVTNEADFRSAMAMRVGGQRDRRLLQAVDAHEGLLRLAGPRFDPHDFAGDEMVLAAARETVALDDERDQHRDEQIGMPLAEDRSKPVAGGVEGIVRHGFPPQS